MFCVITSMGPPSDSNTACVQFFINSISVRSRFPRPEAQQLTVTRGSAKRMSFYRRTSNNTVLSDNSIGCSLPYLWCMIYFPRSSVCSYFSVFRVCHALSYSVSSCLRKCKAQSQSLSTMWVSGTENIIPHVTKAWSSYRGVSTSSIANYRTPPTGHLSFLARRSVITAKVVMEIKVT